MCCDVAKNISNFYQRLAVDGQHRYRSWEHCFRNFQDTRSSSDLTALQLAFYLASWGMYRGSSFLLQRDYTIHIGAVDILRKPVYEELRKSVFDVPKTEQIEPICGLAEDLRQEYRKSIADAKTKKNNPTDTLITKILLGTIGCTPACDRFFREGRRARGLKCPSFGKDFLREMIDFCEEHADELLGVQQTISKRGGVRYPTMKLVDMYFWELGYRRSPESQNQS